MLDAEARCLREHCNPSGSWNVASRAQQGRFPQSPRVQCSVDTELPRLTDLDLRIWLVARIQTDSNGRGPRISTLGPVATLWRWTLLYQAVSYSVEVRRLSRDFLQLLTEGFNVATPSASAYSTCPAFYIHSGRNRLFRTENNFSGIEFCTGNLLQTPIDTCSEVSMENIPPAILQSDWSIARNLGLRSPYPLTTPTREEICIVGWVLGLDGSVTILFHELLSGNMICMCVNMYKSYPNKSSCHSVYCLCLDSGFVLM